MFAFFSLGMRELIVLAVLGVGVAAAVAAVVYALSAGDKDRDE